ncbi:hypothetical protein AKJ57_05965, partial [candidate division MSBL1 archaeon SCGC-AAA259A05]
EQMKRILEKAGEISSRLEDSTVDDRENYTPGWKFNEWELKGVPLRIEIGPKEIEENYVTLVRRDNQKRITVAQSKVEEKVKEILQKIQRNLLENARDFLEKNTRETESYEEFKEILEKKGGFIKAPWCGKTSCEEKIKNETTAKITNIPFKYNEPQEKNCIKCGEKAKYWVNFAKSY